MFEVTVHMSDESTYTWSKLDHAEQLNLVTRLKEVGYNHPDGKFTKIYPPWSVTKIVVRRD